MYLEKYAGNVVREEWQSSNPAAVKAIVWIAASQPFLRSERGMPGEEVQPKHPWADEGELCAASKMRDVVVQNARAGLTQFVACRRYVE